MPSLPIQITQSRRTLVFGSTMHVWSDFFFTLTVPLLPLIKADPDLNLSYTEVGVLRSVFSGASAVLQVPAGFLAEHTGEFWLLIGGNLWVAGGLLIMALVPAYLLLVVVSFLGGLGGGTQHPLASSMVSRAYDDKGRATAVGTVNFAGDLGKMLAPAIGGTLAARLGWRSSLKVVGLAGIGFMVLSSAARRVVEIPRPELTDKPEVERSGEATQVRGFANLSLVGFLDSAGRGAALVFVPFVLEDKGMGLGEISGMIFLLFLGGAAGKYLCGWLVDRWGSVNLIWGTKGLTAALLAALLVAPSAAVGPLIVVLGLGLNGSSSVLYAGVAEMVPAHRRARLYGVFYTTNEVGSVVAPLLFGRIADVFRLRVAVVGIAIMTAAILPLSLGLRRYLAPKEPTPQKQARIE